MKVVPYCEKYRQQVQNICLTTGPSEALTDSTVGSCILSNYCNYYIENEPEHCFILLDEEDNAQGYILCAADYRVYRSRFASYAGVVRSKGGMMFAEMLGEQIALRFFGRRYPAHLHIDISEEYTGKGWGTELMNALISRLESEGVRGIMLIVGAGNKGAIRFYTRHGFRTLISAAGGRVMGRKLR